MIRMRCYWIAFILYATAASAQALTLRVGADISCNASNFSDAVDALPEGAPELVHRIELARNATYSQPTAVARKSIVIVGGYDSCSDPTANADTPTVIGPTTGAVRAMALEGAFTGDRYQVTLQNLVFNGSFGGGLSIGGRMRVRLLDTLIRENTASNGAGVLLTADPSANIEQRTSLVLEGNSRLQGNVANGGVGGGANCDGPGEILLLGREAGVVFNQAAAGGGLFLGNGCVLRVDNPFESATWGISSNTASSIGGGVFAINGGIVLVSNGSSGALISNNIAQAGSGGGILAIATQILLDGTSISANRAGTDGGGLALYDNAALFARRYTINANQATADGGGVFLDNANWLRVDDERPCALGDCRSLSFNEAGLGAGTGEGGAMAAENNAEIVLSKVEMRGNQASHIAAISLSTGSSMQLLNSTLGGNTATELGSLILVSASTLNITHTTIHANATSGLQEAIVRAAGASSIVSVYNSILHENFGTVFARMGNPALGGSCVIAHEAASSVGTALMPLVTNPQLTSVADFRLRPSSPAIDLCAAPPAASATSDDIRSFSRPVNDVPVVNVAGIYDAGAFERLAEPANALFSNGFE